MIEIVCYPTEIMPFDIVIRVLYNQRILGRVEVRFEETVSVNHKKGK